MEKFIPDLFIGFFLLGLYISSSLKHRALLRQKSNVLILLLSEQIFENALLESENASHENADAEELRRLSQNRSSIAERRRLYEARSTSSNGDEKPPQSPLPLK